MEIALASVLGAAAGIPARYFARHLIARRTDEMPKSRLIDGWASYVLFMALSALGAAVLTATTLEAGWVRLAGALVSFEAVLCLSVVDALIRKIPNVLLIALFAIFTLTAALSGAWSFAALKQSAFGALAALVIFVIPSKLGMYIGWGDIKYGVLAGFCLGITGFMQAMLVMAAALGAYALYLCASKRGTLKTKAAMGPSMSLGIVSAMAFPLLKQLI